MEKARKPRIVCCPEIQDERWRWHAPALGEDRLDWQFFYPISHNLIERRVRHPDVTLMRACWNGIGSIRQRGADLLFTHGPRATFWCSLFAESTRVKVPHIAYSFNYRTLPSSLKRLAMIHSFQRVDEFVVYSQMEKALYSSYFGIPSDRIQVKLWGVGKPDSGPSSPLESGDYICAIGENRRDYRTLMAAMELNPEIPLVLVARPYNLHGLRIPKNVKTYVNVTLPTAMNILKHSRFMVLPLDGAEVPCGHVTLVAAMHLGKAFVITNSVGVRDYVHSEQSISCEAGSSEALASAIRLLWQDPRRCDLLGRNGRIFAEKLCSEASMVDYLRETLRQRRLLN